MKNILLYIFMPFVMTETSHPDKGIPAAVHFSQMDTVSVPGKKVLPVPGTSSFLGYQGGTAFAESAPGKYAEINFSPGFTTDLGWSKNGRYLLGGIEYYDWSLKQKDSRGWRILLTPFREKTDQLAEHLNIYNAQWDAEMRFVTVFYGYRGPAGKLSPQMNSDHLHYLVKIDSAGNKLDLLKSFATMDDINDMALSDNILVTAGKYIYWWNLEFPEQSNLISLSPNAGSRVFLNSKQSLALVADKTGRLIAWDLNKPEKPIAAVIHQGEIYDVTFYPGKPIFITTGADNKLKCWWWEDGKITEIKHDLPAGNRYSVSGFDTNNNLIITVYSDKSKAKYRYSLTVEY